MFLMICKTCESMIMSDDKPEVCPFCEAEESYDYAVKCGSCGTPLAEEQALELREGKKVSYCCSGCAEDAIRFVSALVKNNPLERVLKGVELC